MGSQQLYSLSWGEFGTSLSSTVQVLRGHGEMVDVTLAAGGRIFPAHKLVLSAASPLLMELLKSTHCHHPVVMLAGITAPDLEALLQFVYQGEVSVETTQLPSLLQAAHCLNIQALSPQTLTSEKTMAQISVPVMMGEMPQQTIPMNSQLPPMTREMHVSQPAMARDSHSVALPSMPREMTTSSLPSLSRDITTQIASISREMNPAVMPQLSPDVNSPLLPVRKRKRKQRNNSETDSVKWGVTEGEGVGVGGVLVETSRSMEVVDSSMVVNAEELKEEVMDETHCNGEPSSAKKLVSDLPVECTICGVTLRQSRNLRRHMELIHLKIDNSGKQRKLSSKDECKKEEEVTVHAGSVEAEQEAGPSRLAPPPGPSPAQLYHTSTQCDPYQLQPPTMFAADSVFRQQQTELLRGAGLYADTREHCPSVTQ